MQNRSGQIGVEFMLLIGLVLLIFIPLLVIIARNGISSSDRLNEASINEAITRIRDEARDTYYLGTFSKKTITLRVPANIDELSVINATGLDDQFFLEARYSTDTGERTARVPSEVPLKALAASCVPMIDGCTAGYTCERCPIPNVKEGTQQNLELRVENGPVTIKVV